MERKAVNPVIFVITVIFVMLAGAGYCLNLDKAKADFLRADYKGAISEAEAILTQTGSDSGKDEVYYILGLSCLKEGDYPRAKDSFREILDKFSYSRFRNEAKLGLADCYLLEGDYTQAENIYRDLSIQASVLRPQIYLRLNQIGYKNNNSGLANEYADKLKAEFPQSPEALRGRSLFAFSSKPQTISIAKPSEYFSVQVGVFSDRDNAQKLAGELTRKGFTAYIEEAQIEAKEMYRVKAGKLASHEEALELESRLKSEGYPTKVTP